MQTHQPTVVMPNTQIMQNESGEGFLQGEKKDLVPCPDFKEAVEHVRMSLRGVTRTMGGAVSATGAELSEDFNEQLWQP